MVVESAKQDVQVSIGKDFVIMGGDRIEVSADGKKVTAYTNESVETKADDDADADGDLEPDTPIIISRDLKGVFFNGVTIERAADGHLVISAPLGSVITKPGPANDGLFIPPVASSDVSQLLPKKSNAAPQIGAIESTGEHKGEIYGGIYPADNKPIWFSAAPKLMDHWDAAAWAKKQGGALPTRKQGDYLTTLKGKLEIGPAKPDGGGAFTEIFNRGTSFPAGYVWLAEPGTDDSYGAWCQRLSDGDQNILIRDVELPVLSVKR